MRQDLVYVRIALFVLFLLISSTHERYLIGVRQSLMIQRKQVMTIAVKCIIYLEGITKEELKLYCCCPFMTLVFVFGLALLDYLITIKGNIGHQQYNHVNGTFYVLKGYTRWK